MPENPTLWDRTKRASSTAYTKALKPGFDKAYNTLNKLEPHVNKLTFKAGSESFWPGTMDKESEKAARILRSFCKDGFYDHIDAEAARKAEEEGIDLSANKNLPQGKQRVIMKIPAKVIKNAKGLAIFTCMRTGWVIGGSGGAGVLVGRHPETGEWSPPSGIHMQNLSVGFLIGVDLTDTVLVINTYEALEAFTRTRCTLGTEVAVAAGPLGIGGTMDTQVHKKPSPVWSYVKSRGFYGGVAVDGNIVIERTDENEVFYNERVGVAKILRGEVRYPPTEKYKVLIDTLKAAQGDEVDDSLLPDGVPPSDMELAPPGPVFGIPDEDDPDPFGVKALEAEGLSIREAGTHRRASPDAFEFKPSPSSPVYNNYRRSIDAYGRKKEWRSSVTSIASTSSMDRGTQTAEDEAKSPKAGDSAWRDSEVHYSSPLRDSVIAQPLILTNGGHHTTARDKDGSQNTSSPTRTGLGIDTGMDDTNNQSATVNSDKRISTEFGKDAPPPYALSASEPENPNGKVVNGTDKRESQLVDGDSDSENDADYSDFEDVEIVTAVPATAKPKAGMVNIPLRVPPALPPRNPGRSGLTPSMDQTSPEIKATVVEDENLQHEEKEAKTNVTIDHQKSTDVEPSSKLEPRQADDQFHSAAPSPIEEKKLADTVAAPAS